MKQWNRSSTLRLGHQSRDLRPTPGPRYNETLQFAVKSAKVESSRRWHRHVIEGIAGQFSIWVQNSLASSFRVHNAQVFFRSGGLDDLNSQFQTFRFSCLMVAVVLNGPTVILSQDSPPARPLVILIGPPLSGKTTFVTSIQSRYGIPAISVEDLIKDNAAELTKKHRGRTTLAEMRYDPAMSRYVRARLDSMDLGRGAALDGFPATQHQAGELAKMIQELQLTPVALQLELDHVVRQRAAKAGRQSDQPKIIEQRIKDYHREFDTLSLYYPNAKIVKIDGTQSEEKMWQAMQQALDEAELPVAQKK